MANRPPPRSLSDAQWDHIDSQKQIETVRSLAKRRSNPTPPSLARQCLPLAQSDLGVLYANGQGVPQVDVRAHMWFNLSAAQGYEKAVKDRDRIARQMTSDQIAEAQKLAREWKPKAKR